MNELLKIARSLAVEEDGVQVIEYSLIIAVISIALVVSLRGLLGTDFTGFIGRVNSCLMTANCI